LNSLFNFLLSLFSNIVDYSVAWYPDGDILERLSSRNGLFVCHIFKNASDPLMRHALCKSIYDGIDVNATGNFVAAAINDKMGVACLASTQVSTSPTECSTKVTCVGFDPTVVPRASNANYTTKLPMDPGGEKVANVCETSLKMGLGMVSLSLLIGSRSVNVNLNYSVLVNSNFTSPGTFFFLSNTTRPALVGASPVYSLFVTRGAQYPTVVQPPITIVFA